MYTANGFNFYLHEYVRWMEEQLQELFLILNTESHIYARTHTHIHTRALAKKHIWRRVAYDGEEK
jgi:hypothetical protein